MQPFIGKPGEGTVISPIGGDTTYYRATGAQSDGAFALLEQTVPPGHGPRKHVHTREEESFYIIEGTFTFEVGNDRYEVGPGGFVLGPRDVPHTFWNSGTTVGKFLLFITPAGLEPFFTEYSEVIAKFPGNKEKQAECAARYGMSFV
jgi:mannose-6-phosphate isomerase-like protein (cupin superfamily)